MPTYVGCQIRSMNRYAFRPEEWGVILTVTFRNKRPCFRVVFPDGVVDEWVIFDKQGRYEFRSAEDV